MVGKLPTTQSGPEKRQLGLPDARQLHCLRFVTCPAPLLWTESVRRTSYLVPKPKDEYRGPKDSMALAPSGLAWLSHAAVYIPRSEAMRTA